MRSASPTRRTRSLRLLVLAVAMTAGAWTACSTSPSETSQPPSSQPAPARPPRSSSSTTSTTLGTDGAHIYEVRCAGCHGTSGEGNLGPTLSGIADRMSYDEQVRIVTNGRREMLAFSPGLSREQIAAVVQYTRTELS